MNIIEHLSQVVTPKVLKRNATAKESGLLKDFYALFLARILDKEAYNTLTNKRKLPPTQARIDTIEWVDVSIDTISESLAQHHVLDEKKARTMINRATRLSLKEVTNIADGVFVPDYLKEILENPENKEETFVSHIPSWALAYLPAGLLAEVVLPEPLLTKVGGNNTKVLPEPVHADPRVFDKKSTVGGSAIVSKKRLVKDSINNREGQPDRNDLTFDDKNKPYDILEVRHNDDSWMKKILPFIGGIVFCALVWLLVRSCQYDNHTTTVAGNSQPLQTVEVEVFKPASFKLTLDESGEKFISATGSVGSAEQIDKLNSSIERVYGFTAVETTKYIIDETVDTSMPAMNKFSDLLTIVKGIPNASVEVSDDIIVFTNSNATDGEKLVKKAHKLYPEFKISTEKKSEKSKADMPLNDKKADQNPTLIGELQTQEKVTTNSFNSSKEEIKDFNIDNAVDKSIKDADQALNTLSRQQTLTAKELSEALNLQVINFAVNENEIPLANQKILSKAAVLLQKIPDARLKVIGHTDSDGNKDYNQRLSDDRALSVKKYIMSKGFKSTRIKVAGKGETQPIDNNNSEQGKFNNRRIEFKVTQVGQY